MSDLDAHRLACLIGEALERTAFVLTEPAESLDSGQLCKYAAVEFTGTQQGIILLGASDGFCAELASGMLGVEPEEISAETDGCEALSELANIAAGSVVAHLGGADQAFRVSVPRLLDQIAFEAMRSSTSDPAACDLSCTIESSGEPLHIVFKRAA